MVVHVRIIAWTSILTLAGCTCTSTSLAGWPSPDAADLPDTASDPGSEPPEDPATDDASWVPDCLFTMRYMAAPVPQQAGFIFDSDLKYADVYFAMDTSVSMEGEVGNLRDSLVGVIVPGVRATVSDVWFGVGQFQDCRRTTICRNCMGQMQTVTDDVDEVLSALHAVGDMCGGWEPYTQMLWTLATGDTDPIAGYGCTWPISYTCTPPGEVGWACFRTGSLPIIVQIGDEPFQEGIDYCSPAVSRDDAIAALNVIGAKYIGVNSGWSRDDMSLIASGTGSLDSSGDVLVFDIPTTGAGLGNQIVSAITTLARDMQLDISARLLDDPTDEVDTSIFIDRIVPDTDGGHPDLPDASRVCPTGYTTVDTDGDTVPDSFSSVMGPAICFDVYPARNTTVMASDVHQTFRASIEAVGEDVTILGSVEFCFLVPAL